MSKRKRKNGVRWEKTKTPQEVIDEKFDKAMKDGKVILIDQNEPQPQMDGTLKMERTPKVAAMKEAHGWDYNYSISNYDKYENVADISDEASVDKT